MRLKIFALIALSLLTTISYGQTRKTKKPTAKPTVAKQQKQQPVFKDAGNGFTALMRDTLTLDHTLDGRSYWIYEIAYNETADHLLFSYVVKYDQQTPAGRSSLNTAQYLAKNFAIYPDQLYYIRAMQYICTVKRTEGTSKCFQLAWTDEAGNVIAKIPNATFSAKDNQQFIDALIVDSHVNPEGKALVPKLGESAKQIWDKARKP
ncbi:MAG TPA: hypothetical protein VNO50_22360 [Pyrinomonadaceae bacterium]|nr:hypothetical protein [Pyrinomonadaceae bacterium]